MEKRKEVVTRPTSPLILLLYMGFYPRKQITIISKANGKAKDL